MATKKSKKAAPKKRKTASHHIELIFSGSDYERLLRVTRELGVSLETFVLDAINRRLQDVADFRAIKNRCLHLAGGSDGACALCGEDLPP